MDNNMRKLPKTVTNQGNGRVASYIRQRSMAKRVGLDVVYMPPNEGFSKIVAMREYLSGWVEFLWNLVEVTKRWETPYIYSGWNPWAKSKIRHSWHLRTFYCWLIAFYQFLIRNRCLPWNFLQMSRFLICRYPELSQLICYLLFAKGLRNSWRGEGYEAGASFRGLCHLFSLR